MTSWGIITLRDPFVQHNTSKRSYKKKMIIIISPQSKFEMTCASGSFYISPGEIVDCVLTMNFTDLNEFVNIDVESAPNISDSFGITIHSLRIVSTGSNLMTNGEPTYSYEYSLNNTQLNRINLEFGFISNSSKFFRSIDGT